MPDPIEVAPKAETGSEEAPLKKPLINVFDNDKPSKKGDKCARVKMGGRDNKGPYEYEWEPTEKEYREERRPQKWRMHLKVGSYSMQGKPLTNEDDFAVFVEPILRRGAKQPRPFKDDPPLERSFFGLYDGHGGSKCSEFLANNLHKCIGKTMKEKSKCSSREKLETAIKDCEERWVKDASKDKDESGSSLIAGFMENNQLTIANIGDSRAVLCYGEWPSIRGEQITKDLKAGADKTRVLKKGGTLRRANKTDSKMTPLELTGKEKWKKMERNGCYGRNLLECFVPCLKVTSPLRVFPAGLTTCRSFGDTKLKAATPGCIIATPDIYTVSITPAEQALIIATSGVWDVMSNKTAAGVVLNSESSGEAAQKLCKQAYRMGSHDNVSALVVFFSFEFDDSSVQMGWQTNVEFTGKETNKSFVEQMQDNANRPEVLGE